MPIRMTPMGAVAPLPAVPASDGSAGGTRVDAFGLLTGATSSMKRCPSTVTSDAAVRPGATPNFAAASAGSATCASPGAKRRSASTCCFMSSTAMYATSGSADRLSRICSRYARSDV